MLSAGISAPLFAITAATINVSVRSSHNVAPERITDLTATTGGVQGRIELSWTAPQTYLDIKVGDYYIRWSSSSVNDAPFTGDTTAWWNASGGQDLYGWMNDPGENLNFTVNGLIPGTTYYFAITAEDEFGNISSFDIKTQALAQANATAGLDSTVPGSILNLTAFTGDNEGEVKLFWTAPGDDGTSGQLTANLPPNFTPYVYKMKVSDFSLAPYGGSADAWWTMAPTVKPVLISTAQIPGTEQTVVITGLTPGAKLWFGIKAYDDGGNWSFTLNVSSATVSPDVMGPSPVTDMVVADSSTANALTLRWTAPGDDGTAGDIVNGRFRIQYSTYAIAWSSASAQVVVSSSMASGEIQTYEAGSLLSDSTYYFVLWTADDGLNWSALSNTAMGWTLDNIAPAAPTGVTAIAGDAFISLSWNTNTEDDFSAYQIYRSTDNSVYTNILSTDSLSFTDTGLTNFTTYYYYLTAKDGSDNESVASDMVYATPKTVITDFIIPDVPGGVYGEFSADASSFTLRWSMVTINSDGSACVDFAGYRIYRATGVWGPFNLINQSTIAANTEYTCLRSTQTYFYAVTAYDSASPVNESGMSMCADTTDELNLWIAADGAAVRIPAEIAAVLRNGYDEDIVISTDSRKSADENYPSGRVLRSYNFETRKNNFAKDKVNFVFDKSLAEIKIYYYYDIVTDSDGDRVISALKVKESETRNSLALVWFNGVEWVKIGGEVNTAENCVRILTDKLGSYQLRVAPRATAFSVIDGPIPKIFTPNGDNLNDECSFYYDNPNSFAPSGEVFDIRGRKVSDMKFGGTSSSVSGSLVWDGKNSGGQYVSPGVYIWQIKAEGKVYNGTVVVAR
ncbi:MAG: hypothetical protein CVU78_06060 [Elusimicrobia bacterium HGW-Elusimicrobia-2]|nr:MAG: hypothetical protein CVU78_06060 [Elusimicrobia bacterium HGW-Elusimicrobia-2]